jgi:hypothetical protein
MYESPLDFFITSFTSNVPDRMRLSRVNTDLIHLFDGL